MDFLKEYFPTIFKTLVFIGFVIIIILSVVLGGTIASKYFAKEIIMDEYLISKSKISNLTSNNISFKPTKFVLETDDGVYTIESDDFFQSLTSVNTLTGESFEKRKEVISKLEEKDIQNVKRGSLKYLGKNKYEAFDFDTKHYFTVIVDNDSGEIEITDKEVL